MKKRTIIFVIIFLIILALIVTFIVYKVNKKIEIPNNPKLKISINYFTAPTIIDTYYFYDDTLIETYTSSGVLASGPVRTTTTTKYYFKDNIDLKELEEFLEEFPKTTNALIGIEIKLENGDYYYIDDSSKNTSLIAHGDILYEIKKITDKAYKQEESESKD